MRTITPQGAEVLGAPNLHIPPSLRAYFSLGRVEWEQGFKVEFDEATKVFV
jgi:hypothetical protein